MTKPSDSHVKIYSTELEYEIPFLFYRIRNRILRNKKETLVSLSFFEDTLVVSTYLSFSDFLAVPLTFPS